MPREVVGDAGQVTAGVDIVLGREREDRQLVPDFRYSLLDHALERFDRKGKVMEVQSCVVLSSPLLFSLALHGFNTATKVYKEAYNISPFLTSIKHVARLLVLEYVYPPEKHERADCRAASVIAFCEGQVYESSASTFSEICSILRYLSLCVRLY